MSNFITDENKKMLYFVEHNYYMSNIMKVKTACENILPI